MLTNAHMRKYGDVYRINPNRSWKYQNIISKLFPPKRKYYKSSLPKTTGDEYRMEREQNTITANSNRKYQNITSKTNPPPRAVSPEHILDYDVEEPVNANSSWKYQNIISKVTPPPRTVPTDEHRLEWDENTDPSMIVDMIRINKSLGKDYQYLINVLIDMGIVE